MLLIKTLRGRDALQDRNSDSDTSTGFAESAPGEIWDVSEFNEDQDLPSQF